MKAHAKDMVHLSSPFRHPELRLFFGRARLHTDRLEFKGFGWKGWYQRTITFKEIKQVRWWTGVESPVNMVLYLQNNTTYPFWVAAGGLWKFKLEELGGKRLRVKEELPEAVYPASAA